MPRVPARARAPSHVGDRAKTVATPSPCSPQASVVARPGARQHVVVVEAQKVRAEKQDVNAAARGRSASGANNAYL
jgi:hypothetical protein